MDKKKCKAHKILMKNRRKENKNKLKINKLFLFITSNLFYLFELIEIRIK